jgi:DNA polymerase elongation subunit (family B)
MLEVRLGMVTVKACILGADYVLEGGGKEGVPSPEVSEEGGERPVVRLWGKTQDGRSIVILDRGFEPYFYVEPSEELSLEQLEGLAERIRGLELEETRSRPVSVELTEKRFLGLPRRVLRVGVRSPRDVPKFRELVKDWKGVKEEYEYAVPFYRRYLIDRGLIPMGWIEVTGKPVKTGYRVDKAVEAERLRPLGEERLPGLRVLAFDIETSEAGGGESVIMISLADSRGFSRVLTYKGKRRKGMEVLRDERAMIERFVKLVRERDPDIILGYNTDRFDFTKLDARAEALKVGMDLSRDSSGLEFRRRMRVSAAGIAGRVHVDLFDFVENIMQHYLSTEVLTLDSVTREILGKGKGGMKWREIEKAWRDGKDMKRLADYCLQDSRLTLMLGKAVLPQIYEMCRVTGQTMFDVSRMSYSQLVEWLLMRKAHGIGELSPNRPKYEEVRKRRLYPAFTGGYVHPPVEGIHEGIALYDFASLYPSITITHNISPETLDCMCCGKKRCDKGVERVPEGEHYFCRKHRGFIPAVLEELVDQRQRIKRRMGKARPGTVLYRMLDNRQNALKILANASYGYYAYAGSRWYSRVCAQSITAWGRFYIRKVISMAERLKYPVIYGDTDSLFLRVKTKKSAREFLERANKGLPGVMELDLEGIYSVGMFVLAKSGMAAKKRYALLDETGRMTIRGFEKVRRDWSPIAKDTQEGVLRAILKERSPEKAVRLVRRNIERIEKGRVEMDELVIYSQLTKPLNQYEQVGPHVVAARKAQERGRVIRPGTSISLVITRGEGSISSRAEPLEDAKDYDPDYYIRNQVIPAALRVLSGLGYTEEDLTGEGSQSSLEGFFRRRDVKQKDL